MAHIIFLHGASSSGKSTIAKALQQRIEKPFWHISIDHLRDAGVLPSGRFKSGEFLEHILDTEGWLEELVDLLAEHDVFFAAVHCPLEILVQREAARGDRPVGSAKQDFETIHAGKRYDIELQSEDGVDTNVERLLAAWRTSSRSSSFVESKSA